MEMGSALALNSVRSRRPCWLPPKLAPNLMIRLPGTILIFFLALPLSAQAEEVVMMYSYGRMGALQYSIPGEKAARLRRWETTSQEPPLKLQAAVQYAENWYRNRYSEVKGWQPVSVSLSSSNRHDKNYVWYYMIMLQPLDTAAYRTMDDTVMILMDGSVVEPKPREK
jgi:hypothetical protein